MELAAFILHHPAVWQETKDQAAVLSRSAGGLPARALAGAQERGRAGELEGVIEGLLAPAEV